MAAPKPIKPLKMQPRVSFVTLGVADLAAGRAFYEKMGWKASRASDPSVAFFQGRGCVLALWSRALLAGDAGVANDGLGFDGLALAYNVRRKTEVARILAQAERAGGRIAKPAQDTFWGGHAGYFADVDGHLWEVAWNPFMPLDARGTPRLPPPRRRSAEGGSRRRR